MLLKCEAKKECFSYCRQDLSFHELPHATYHAHFCQTNGSIEISNFMQKNFLCFFRCLVN